MKNNINQKSDKQKIEQIINLNPDSKQYFFSKADEKWLDFLWKNGFLDILKEAKDPMQYRYQEPELTYLLKVAHKKPKRVTDIMLEICSAKKRFIPMEVGHFLYICRTLPAKQLSRIVPNIKKYGWVRVGGRSLDYFDYKEMLETLLKAKDYENLLILIEVMLTIKTKEDFKQNSYSYFTENPFYCHNLYDSKIFECLVNLNDEYAKKAISMVCSKVADVVKLGNESENESIFDIQDAFHFHYQVDFFTLTIGEEDLYNDYTNHIQDLFATAVELARKIIGSQNIEPEQKEEVYKECFKSLPNSQAMWRLRLYVMSLDPECFKTNLKKAFFRIFEDGEQYKSIMLGPEYKKALKVGFYTLSDKDKRVYVKQAIEYFQEQIKKESGDQMYISNILSMINDDLTEEEKNLAKESGFIIDPSYEPQPSIIETRTGWVIDKGPVPPEEFTKRPIGENAEMLRKDWSPEELKKDKASHNLWNPTNAEGAGKVLQQDISKRLQEYVDNATLFFERDVLDQHYTYSFLQGIQEAIQNNKQEAKNINWSCLIDLLKSITKSGIDNPFDRDKRRSDPWLLGWNAVHSAMSDVIKSMLGENDREVVIDFKKYRNDIFCVIQYLLSHQDPTPSDEKVETAPMTTRSSGEQSQVVSAFMIAINAVRGRAFQALIFFSDQDTKQFTKTAIR